MILIIFKLYLMNQITKAAMSELTALIGCKSYQRISQACTGKWRSTTDYGLLFDNGCYHFVSNGMGAFDQNLLEVITEIKTVREHREEHLAIILEQVERDNAVAATEGLSQIKVLDTAVNTESEHCFLWAYVLLDINGKQVKFIETMLNYALRTDNMQKWFTDRPQNTFTAGAVREPDFIFGNVRFSSSENLYKIK